MHLPEQRDTVEVQPSRGVATFLGVADEYDKVALSAYSLIRLSWSLVRGLTARADAYSVLGN